MKKKIEELFRLAMKAQEKTSAFVSFETSNEWLMEKGRKVKLFENEVEAKAYLRTNGYTDEEMEFLKFEEVWC